MSSGKSCVNEPISAIMADIKEKIDNDPDRAEKMRQAAQEATKMKDNSTTEQNTGSGQ